MKSEFKFPAKTEMAFSKMLVIRSLELPLQFQKYVRQHMRSCYQLPKSYKHLGKVEMILEQRYIAFLSPSKICENLNF